MNDKKRIAIVGYGPGGIAAAALLRADGHEVDAFERAPVLGPVGAGFLLQPVGLAVLWELGLLEQVFQHGSIVRRLYGETRDGKPVMDMRYHELDRRFFGVGMQRGALFSMLDSAWTTQRNIHCGCEITAIDTEKGELKDAQGQLYTGYDIIIIANGSASLLREQVSPAKLNKPYPWGAQWCLVEQADWQWDAELRQRYIGARNMVGMLPVGTRPGDATPRLSFFWSLPVSALDGDRSLRQWRAQLEHLWPEAAQRLQSLDIPDGLASARYRDTVHQRWHQGRCVLLGDAAHAMSPQLGQGVNMALLDALALRNHLRHAKTLEGAFSGYTKERSYHLGMYHFWSRWLTPLFQSESDRAAQMRDLFFHPLSRLPGSRGQALRILTGTRSGWTGQYRFKQGFFEAIAGYVQ